MEGLIGAVAGLAVAVTGLTGAYIRAQRQNGHGRTDVIAELRAIKGLLEQEARDRAATVTELRREHREMHEELRDGFRRRGTE